MRIRTMLLALCVAALLIAVSSPAAVNAETSSEITYCCAESVESLPGGDQPPEGRHHRKRREIHPAPEGPGEVPKPQVEEADHPDPVAPTREAVRTPAAETRRPAAATKPSISERIPVSETSPRPVSAVSDGSGSGNSDGGGSSPILLVLIAVAALAVLSAGVAFFNERLRTRRR